MAPDEFLREASTPGVLIAAIPLFAGLIAAIARIVSPAARMWRRLDKRLSIYDRMPETETKTRLRAVVEQDAARLVSRYELYQRKALETVSFNFMWAGGITFVGAFLLYALSSPGLDTPANAVQSGGQLVSITALLIALALSAVGSLGATLWILRGVVRLALPSYRAEFARQAKALWRAWVASWRGASAAEG